MLVGNKIMNTYMEGTVARVWPDSFRW